jgi:glyoxylase-like metal-dependent hydrolase (beta-lactamase superfamily II)
MNATQTTWETLIPRLHASPAEPLPFAPSLDIRAFLLARDAGNLLVYDASVLEAEVAALQRLGGARRQYLNHRHEAMFGADRAARALGATLVSHEHERRSIAEHGVVDEVFSERGMLDDDFEVIPTPGHTRGATAYLWDTGEHRALFTGDSVYLRDGEWVAAVLQGSDRGAYLISLELIRELDFDVLVPWASTGGRPPHALTHAADARRRIDAIIARVRRGEDH